MKCRHVNTLVVGSGAAGLCAALRLKAEGIDDVLLVSEGLRMGTSINTGSDKQTYYKLGLYGAEPDSPLELARSLYEGGSVHGDLALVEAAMSARCFFHLADLGVPFPHDEFGQYIGYKTDHDPRRRATSCGPYTSREMCLALIAALRAAGVEIAEHRSCCALLKTASGAAGALFLDRKTGKFECVLAADTVFATGGPGGLYRQSVYPACHTGGIGLALAIGAEARNLPESQFGLASTRFRWNVSGTYMQVLPRFVSTATDGSDERDFLLEHFGADTGKMNSAVFLKGYQWPFDVRKAENGSSIIDLLVHRETAERGRRVFLDFRSNPPGLDFAALSTEARDYLERSGALFGTPLERLEKMNPGAVRLYAEHGIDLRTRKLEIAVCAQHNNGGLAGNIWYESTNVPHFFPIGEVNGSHGVVRPGGSALNAGQTGAFRAAEYIARRAGQNTPDWSAAEAAAEKELRRCRGLLSGARDWRRDRAELQERMTRRGGHLRNREALATAEREAKELCLAIQNEGYRETDASDALVNVQLALAHFGYLSAIRFQLEAGSGSRGSAAELDGQGRFVPENPAFRKKILVSRFDGENFVHRFEPCRPLPETDGWFENVWADCRNGKIYQQG